MVNKHSKIRRCLLHKQKKKESFEKRKEITRYILNEQRDTEKINIISNSLDMVRIYKKTKNHTIFCDR